VTEAGFNYHLIWLKFNQRYYMQNLIKFV